jgi:hypothetical protein
MLTLVEGQGISTTKAPYRQVEKSHNKAHSFEKLIYANKNTHNIKRKLRNDL